MRGIAVAGDACIDVYAAPEGSRSAVGGNALNVAVNLARLGVRSAFFGVIGDDRNGDRIFAALREMGIGASGVRTARGSSWVAFISRDERGFALVDAEEPGVGGAYAPTREELDSLARFDHVHLANLGDPATTLAYLSQRGVSTSYDFGEAEGDVRAPTGIAFFSQPERNTRAADRIAHHAIECGARLAIVTVGANGSLGVDRERALTVSARRIEPVDTLGAGDSYIAAFLAGWLTGTSLGDAMTIARDHASQTCLHWAAWPQTPLPIDAYSPT